MDGGVLSNLPIEAALTMGATEIIALSLDLPILTSEKVPAAFRFMDRLGSAMARREMQLEMALAEANHVPVRTIHLKVPDGIQVWDFPRSSELIQSGYEMAKDAIAEWSTPSRPGVVR
jgi:predicted acylesterase/phospholipase RssA